jgi:hypothetical protein
MSKKLAIVAVSGIVIGAVLLGTAALVGGQELRRRNFDFGDLFSDRESCGVTLAHRRGSRNLDWSDGDSIGIRLPADVRYRRGQGEQVVIEGDQALLPLIEIDNGNIRLNCRMRNMGRFTITLPGRDFRHYDLAGSVNLTMEGVDQPRLDFDMAGAIEITAAGRVDQLDLDTAGSGEGRFGDLEANIVTIDAAGSSDIEVAPRERLSVDAAGSTEVTLRTEPRTIDMDIAGSGRIIHPDGQVTRSSGFSSRHIERDPDADPDQNRDQNSGQNNSQNR